LSVVSRGVSAFGWLLLLAALGAAFAAQGRLSAAVTAPSGEVAPGPGGVAALWLLIAGLAVSAIAILF
jgi:hypothetical protein